MWVAVERQSIRFFIQKPTEKKHRVKPNANWMSDNSKKKKREKSTKKGKKARESVHIHARARVLTYMVLSLYVDQNVSKNVLISVLSGYPCPANIINTPNQNRYDTATVHYSHFVCTHRVRLGSSHCLLCHVFIIVCTIHRHRRKLVEVFCPLWIYASE